MKRDGWGAIAQVSVPKNGLADAFMGVNLYAAETLILREVGHAV